MIKIDPNNTSCIYDFMTNVDSYKSLGHAAPFNLGFTTLLNFLLACDIDGAIKVSLKRGFVTL